jgi:hypothetical protein
MYFMLAKVTKIYRFYTPDCFPIALGEFPVALGKFPRAIGELPRAIGELPRATGKFPRATGKGAEVLIRINSARRRA